MVSNPRFVTRRRFIGSMAAMVAAPTAFAQSGQAPIPVHGLNHLTLSVSDIGRSLEFYQGLFGMPIVARQARTIILRIGEGPQFLALGGGGPDASQTITHFCLEVDNFDADRLVRILGEHDVTPADGGALSGGPRRVRVRMRGEEFGGAVEGTPELYFGDPDGVVVQLQDRQYCGGRGVLGELCQSGEAGLNSGVFEVRGLNHFTVFTSDQQRSIAFYQELFGMPVNTYQGALPLLSVGAGSQFLALAPGPAPARIHHVCMTMEDFQHERVMRQLEVFGVKPRAEGATGPVGPLTSYVTMRMPDRGGASTGTPELYFTDPDGILLQLQDVRYCGGAGYYGEICT